MATSTLDPDNIPEPDRKLGSGHGTGALGPSDTSDTGSDVQGGLRWAQEADIGLDKGTHEDPDSGRRDMNLDPDIDSDTDALGTGERGTAGRDSDISMGADIDVDRIDTLDPSDLLDMDEETPLPPRDADRPDQRR